MARLRDVARRAGVVRRKKWFINYDGLLKGAYERDFHYPVGKWLDAGGARMCRRGFHTPASLSRTADWEPYLSSYSYGKAELLWVEVSGFGGKETSKEVYRYIKVLKKVKTK